MPTSKLTKERDLRDSKPVWADSPRIGIRSATTPKADRYDTIVIGAGISGALVSHALHRPGQSMLVIDKSQPVMGSSVASTAMIQHEIGHTADGTEKDDRQRCRRQGMAALGPRRPCVSRKSSLRSTSPVAWRASRRFTLPEMKWVHTRAEGGSGCARGGWHQGQVPQCCGTERTIWPGKDGRHSQRHLGLRQPRAVDSGPVALHGGCRR